jgi:hypothetical protein
MRISQDLVREDFVSTNLTYVEPFTAAEVQTEIHSQRLPNSWAVKWRP